MPKINTRNLADYVLPLDMNGLSGRMLCLPAQAGKKREILFVPGLHTSLERLFGVIEYLNKYGGVTLPDLPGFGGMRPFYKIGQQPTVDNMADYLAAFVKLRYKNRRLTIMGFSWGFLVATRMLQKYPEVASKVDLLISLAGLTNGSDFKWRRHSRRLLWIGSSFFSLRLPAFLVKNVALRGPFIRLVYRLVEHKNPKLRDADRQERSRRVDFEIKLWQDNDLRTYMKTSSDALYVNFNDTRVDLKVYHIAVNNDRYFNNTMVEHNMCRIYKDFESININLPAHAPTIIATAAEAAIFVPPKIRRLLNKQA